MKIIDKETQEILVRIVMDDAQNPPTCEIYASPTADKILHTNWKTCWSKCWHRDRNTGNQTWKYGNSRFGKRKQTEEEDRQKYDDKMDEDAGDVYDSKKTAGNTRWDKWEKKVEDLAYD